MPRIRSSITFAAVAGLIAVSAAFTACGGGGSSKKTPTSAPASTSSSGGGASTPASSKTQGAATQEPTKGTNSSGNGGSIDDLKDIAEKFGNATFNADYKISGSLGADITDGTMKLVKKGSDKFRFEVNGKQNGEDLAVIFIETPDVSAFCLKNAGEFGALLGVADGDGVCFKSNDESTNPVGSLSDSLKDFENQDVTVLDTSKRTIAGQDGTCYKTQDNSTQEISTACFASDGTMLFVETEGDDQGAIEATSVSKSVSDSDFDPPYELKDAPSFLGGDTGGDTP
jgi:hypothetical protein